MSRNIPRVSVGLPVYNGEKYIKEAIESILAQTFTDFELIISDNASIDKTEKICKDYAKSDERIRYYRADKNHGAPWNFNNTFYHSRGNYFRWQCVDDIIAPEHFETSVEILDTENDVVLCYPLTTIVDENGGPIGEYNNNLDLRQDKPIDRYKRLYENLGLCNVQYGLIRSSVLKKTSLFGNYIGSDTVFIGELALYGKFYEIPMNLFFLRMHSGSSSSIKSLIELQKFYDPSKNKNFIMQNCRHIIEKMKTVNRSELGFLKRNRIHAYILRDAISSREEILNELKCAMKMIFLPKSSNLPTQLNPYNPYLLNSEKKPESQDTSVQE